MSSITNTSEWSLSSTLPHIIHALPYSDSVRQRQKRRQKQLDHKKYGDDSDESEYEDECEEEHITDIILTFVLGVDPRRLINKEPVVNRPKSFNSSSSSSNKVHTNFMYFHLEFSILNREDYIFSTDVVIFSKSIAKIYPTNCTSKMTTPCEFDKTLWITWTEQIPIVITDETIINFWNLTQNGGIRVKCWDQRDKCSIQTRFDRPRSISGKNNMYGQVNDNSTNSIGLNDVRSTIDVLKTYCRDSSNMKKTSFDVNHIHTEHEETLEVKKDTIKHNNTSLRTLSSAHILTNVNQRSVKMSKIGDFIDNWGSCCLVLQSGHLFRLNPPKWIVARKPTVYNVHTTSKLPPSSSVILQIDNSFEDILIGMKLTTSLMSLYQRRKFKPIILTIDKLHNLPVISHKSYEEMRDICEPVRLITKFSNIWNHQSREYFQDKEVYMDEVQVILTNKVDCSQLRELIQTTPIIIDLHDRGRKPAKMNKPKRNDLGGLFCTEPNDDKIGEVQPNLRTNTFSVEDTDQKNDETNDESIEFPTGRINVDLSEMVWLKCATMKQKLPVLPVSESDLDLHKCSKSIKGNPRHISRDYIGYVDWQCHLSIEIEININLNELLQINTTPGNVKTFERMVFILEKAGSNKQGISEDLPVHIIQANINSRQSQYIPCIYSRPSSSTSLYSTKINSEQDHYLMDQLVTGFHLVDEDFDLIVLETANSNISKNLEELFNKSLDTFSSYSVLQSTEEKNCVKCLKNSGLLFTERLYAPLNWCLQENIMAVPMRQITGNSILHIRDLLPRLAYCAINRITSLRLHCQTLSSSFRANLFPTCEMMKALFKEFCVSSLLTNLKSSPRSLSIKSTQSSLTKIDTDQVSQYSFTDKNEGNIFLTKDLSKNKRRYLSKSCSTMDRSSKRPLSKDKSFYNSLIFDEHYNENKNIIYNYSIQSLNSSVISKNELYYEILSKKEKYAYCNDYLHSGSFELTQEDWYNNKAIKRKLALSAKSFFKSSSRNTSKRKKERRWNKSTNLLCENSPYISFKAKLCRDINESQKSV
ncbi:unnamed protein product [Trichobilharzia regenti]|nr:unnamed protein product [Trichobilharzia regenti]